MDDQQPLRAMTAPPHATAAEQKPPHLPTERSPSLSSGPPASMASGSKRGEEEEQAGKGAHRVLLRRSWVLSQGAPPPSTRARRAIAPPPDVPSLTRRRPHPTPNYRHTAANPRSTPNSYFGTSPPPSPTSKVAGEARVRVGPRGQRSGERRGREESDGRGKE
jgi:hypothetical protein